MRKLTQVKCEGDQVPVEITFRNKNAMLFVVKYNVCLIRYYGLRREKSLCANHAKMSSLKKKGLIRVQCSGFILLSS